MNCIVVDDDSFARKIIEDFVKKTDSLNLVCSLESALEAINVLELNNNIDLIFLDIEMPDMTGIEFLNSLTKLPQVIIVSVREKYAIKAFDYDVTDYLLKPVSYSRFSKAVNKAMDRQKNNRIQTFGSEIFIRHNNSLVKLKYSDILWIEAMENYVVINTFHEKYTMHFTMRSIEEKLPTEQFMRIHRSYIVNINGIQSIEEKTIHIATAETSTNCIPIGKMYRERLLNEINVIAR